MVELSPLAEQLVEVGSEPGSKVVCYAESVGVRLTRGDGGKIFFRLEGFGLPKDILSYKKDEFNPQMIKFIGLGPDGISLEPPSERVLNLSATRLRELDVVTARVFEGQHSGIFVEVPEEIKRGEETIKTNLSVTTNLKFTLALEWRAVSIKNTGYRPQKVAVKKRCACGGGR